MRVEPRQWQRWYRTLDQLLERKTKIEHELYLTLRNLAAFQVDAVFDDRTSTYFEGKGPMTLGANGYSRDGKPLGFDRRMADRAPCVPRQLARCRYRARGPARP
jgi:hypothetical protein